MYNVIVNFDIKIVIFILYQLNEDETKRINLIKRAHEICNENNGDDWDEPENEWLQETNSINVQQLTISERKDSDTSIKINY